MNEWGSSNMDKRKVLIVDDEEDALFVLEKELAARGYSVITTDNGDDALALAKSQIPDLIILDVLMPGMDGTEVDAQLHEDALTRDIPVIFLTCLFQNTEERKQGHVVDDGKVLVSKPYSKEALLTQIEKLVDRQWAYQPA